MIRKYKPQRIIEIGAGHSTLLASLTLEQNGGKCDFSTIEPYPKPFLSEQLGDWVKIIAEPVESIPVSLFKTLKNNDILFIDSSHTVRMGGDVLHEILEILPRLNPGVIIHIHDIFLPYHMPKNWVKDRHIFWTEQYLVQAFLAFNDSFEILWSAGLMQAEQSQTLMATCPYHKKDEAGSLWLRRTQ